MFNQGPKKKERAITLIFSHAARNQHVAGVEALAVSKDSCLYTASRDSIVKRWRVHSGRPACDASFEGHIDWVNDALVYQDRLVTCSSDRTVKIWQANEEARCLHTVQHHTDYVTSLAASEAAGKLVSAGLHSEVITYDMETLQAHLLMPHPSGGGGGSGGPGGGGGEADAAGGGGTGGAPAAQAPMRSVYALVMNQAGTMVAAGTTEAFIRLLDPRTGHKIMKLKGHTDNVRCLLLNAEGNLLLSGSSDNTVRLWDLGQQRCIQTLNVHTDSVWCLAATPDFSMVYSGGRDKGVYVTHMGLRKAWLLAREELPVRDIALSDEGARLWVATTSASVHGYDLPPAHSAAPPQVVRQRQRHHAVAAAAAAVGLDPAAAVASTSDSDTEPPPSAPPPSPRRRRRHQPQPQLPDSLGLTAALSRGGSGPSGAGRHVFGTSPSMRLRHSHDPGQVEEELLRMPSVVIEGAPGLVAVRILNDKRHLLTQDARGNVQLWDVLAGQPIQQLGKVSIADVERRLFRPMFVEPWFSADVKLGALAINLQPPKCFAAEAYAQELGLREVPDDQKINLGACLLRSALSKWARCFSSLYLSGAPLPGLDDPGSEQMPRFNADHPPAVVSVSASGVAWRLSACAFTGREREGEELPAWACEAVLRGLLPYVKELKAAFVLQPAEGSSLPSLMQSRLNAPRILQVMKVANYCVSKLAELNVPLCTHEVGLTQDTQAPPANGQQYLELMCNGVAVPYSLSIATVKKLIWKRSDDLIFHYRILDPARLAPFPNLGPPEA